ncbi:hypothetical protein BDD12DRAFT_839044 [Trichophaea hybrida]|nr:hypothetical protein BDD12DRAFT_839044 [Trichophaea hybrida]
MSCDHFSLKSNRRARSDVRQVIPESNGAWRFARIKYTANAITQSLSMLDQESELGKYIGWNYSKIYNIFA